MNITASQSGNQNYNFADNIVQNLIIDKAKQTISFNSLSTKTFGDLPFALSATSTSEIPVTFECLDSTVAKVNGKTLRILKAGTVTIAASQTGNENYYSAPIQINCFSFTKIY